MTKKQKIVLLVPKFGGIEGIEPHGSLESLYAHHNNEFIGCSLRTLKTRLKEQNGFYESELVSIFITRLRTKSDFTNIL